MAALKANDVQISVVTQSSGKPPRAMMRAAPLLGLYRTSFPPGRVVTTAGSQPTASRCYWRLHKNLPRAAAPSVSPWLSHRGPIRVFGRMRHSHRPHCSVPGTLSSCRRHSKCTLV
jgi:hypothetical protein